ncbi:MAG: glycosyltransferase [Planctomycetota bacterium]|nr:glycosyltransferase [Planctomycetota bacterium]
MPPPVLPIDRKDFLCTLILPVYDAVDCIASTVGRLQDFVANHPEWCVLLVVDGCPFGSAQALKPLIENLGPAIRMDTYEQNRGKGFALRRGLDLATTPYRIYTDVDLAYDPEEAVKILSLLMNGADVGVVNRANPSSRFVMSPSEFPRIYKRHLMSRGFNWWLRQMLPISILDTQAGLKGLTDNAWQTIGPHMTTDGFFFDVELLARAGAMDLRIAEIPVMVTYIDPTTVRMVTHGWAMMKDTIRLRKDLRLKKIVKRATPEPAGIANPVIGLRAKPL